MKRRKIFIGLPMAALFNLGASAFVAAADLAPEVFVNQVTTQVMQSLRADKSYAGNVSKIGLLVDQQIMPHVNFRRMCASAVGPIWAKASVDQQKQIEDEFKILLIRIYAGALSQINDQVIAVKKPRYSPDDMEIVVKTEIRGNGDPIQLDYRIEKTSGQGFGWKIINFNVLGVWMIETYRSQFIRVLNNEGIDGLIASLKERNKTNVRHSANVIN